MTRQKALSIAAIAAAAALIGWTLFIGLPRWYLSSPLKVGTVTQPASATPRIKAKLFFVAEDGVGLEPVEREVPFGEGTLEQAKRIVEAQLAEPPQPLVSAVPAGTKLRALYLGDQGRAFVDLTREVSAAQPGGSLSELLTIYTIVEALTANLPAITEVQILVDGRQVDTLAGHVDLRHPVPKSTTWVERPAGPAPPGGDAASPAGADTTQPSAPAGR